MDKVSPYLKAVAPLVVGLILVIVGAVVDEDTLVQLGIGALGSAGISLAVPAPGYTRPRK